MEKKRVYTVLAIDGGGIRGIIFRLALFSGLATLPAPVLRLALLVLVLALVAILALFLIVIGSKLFQSVALVKLILEMSAKQLAPLRERQPIPLLEAVRRNIVGHQELGNDFGQTCTI